MAAANVVRMRLRPGAEARFLEIHREMAGQGMPGLTGGFVVRTGERDVCFVGERESAEALAAARPAMIAQLDRFRDLLEDLGGGLGVTDPVSGEIAVRLG